MNIDINGDKECGSNHELCLTCVQKGVNLDMVVTMSQSVLRIGFASASGSMALIAQGIYSIADSLTKVMNYVSIKISKAPPSTLFPYGYGKIQFVTQTRLIHIDLLEQMKIAMRKGIVPIIKDSDSCNFGKWINDSGKKLYQQSSEFKLLERHHDQFHNIAIELTKILKKRDFDMAKIAMRELQH